MFTVIIKNTNQDVLETVGMPTIPRESEKVLFYSGGGLVSGYVKSVAYLVGKNGLLSSVDLVLTNVTYYG